MNILIVEDEEHIANGIAAILKKNTSFPCTIHIAFDGNEAWELYHNANIDLILTDIRMQEMDGLEMLKRFYQQNHITRYIIISGYSEFSYAQQAIQLGVIDYLLKPVDKERLLEDVKKVYDSLPENQKAAAERTLPNLPFFQLKLNSEDYPATLKKIILDIDTHYMTNLSMQSLAQKYMISPSYLSRLINVYIGNNFAWLLDYFRLRKAAEYLIYEPDYSISYIAQLVGYSSDRQMYKAFQKRLLCTPGEFRQNEASPTIRIL